MPDGCSRPSQTSLQHVVWDAISRPEGLSIPRLARALRRLTDCRLPTTELRGFLGRHACFHLFRPALASGGCSTRVWVKRAHLAPPQALAAPGASPRLAAAVANARRLPSRAFVSDGTGKFAPSEGEIYVAPRDAPARFSHRRREPRPDAECISTPFPVANQPLVTGEQPPPPDLPMVYADSLSEIITSATQRRLRGFFKKLDRSFKAAEQGRYQLAAKRKPADLLIRWEQATKSKFRGIPMDLTERPYRTLQPSVWPHRPPSTDLKIRLIRREFRAYPQFPDKDLRSMISHGNHDYSSCTMITYLAPPHGSAYRHFAEWRKICEKEVANKWARTGFPERIATWPTRSNPTGMVQRSPQSAFRRTDDMSWPHFGADSPNSSADVPFAEMVQLWMFCLSAAVMLMASAPLKVILVDLKSAYKRTGEQRAKLLHRTILVPSGQQTNDRTCFGQSDGPSSFGRQSGFIAFVIKEELRYAALSYPVRCPRILQWQEARRNLMGSEPVSSPTTILVFLMVFIDDFASVAFDDALWRADGSPVMLSNGHQKCRAQLVLEVKLSVIRRFGHESTEDKLVHPTRSALVLGATVDLDSQSLSLDPAKRSRYGEQLEKLLKAGKVTFAAMRSLVFKLLVVCECVPEGRQHLAPLLRFMHACERSSGARSLEPEALGSLRWFKCELASQAPISVPLACREVFPDVQDPGLLVVFLDASRSRSEWSGGAFCAVHEGRLIYAVHQWTASDIERYHIGVLEAVALLWEAALLPTLLPEITHLLEFTDNTGAEHSYRSETPHNTLLQKLVAKRQQHLLRRGVFARIERVPSVQNKWADMLSRGSEEAVLCAARARSLVPYKIHLTHAYTDIDSLVG